MDNNKEIITNPSYLNILKISWPTMASYTALLMVSLCDLYFVGSLGREAIAAVAIGTSIWTLLLNVIDGFRQATTILVAKFVSQEQPEHIAYVFQVSLACTTVVSALLFLFADQLSGFVYNLMTNDPQVMRLGKDYFPILLKFSFATIIFFSLEGWLRGYGNTFTPMVIIATVGIINCFLDWAMVQGRVGFPNMGVKGVATATGIAEVTGLIIGIIYLVFNKQSRNFLRFSPKLHHTAKEFIQISLEVGLFALSINSAKSIFNAIVGKASTVMLAAHQIADQVFFILYQPIMAFMVTASILTSALASTKQIEMIQTTTNRCLGICLGIVTICGSILWIATPWLAHAFSPHDSQVSALAIKAIKIVIFNQVLGAYYLIMRGTLSGVGMSFYAMIAAFASSYLCFLPLAWTLIHYYDFGLVGGYTALTTWTLVSCIMFAWRYYSTVIKPEKLHEFLKHSPKPNPTEKDFSGMTGLGEDQK